jgi:hypothetical protein
LHKIGAIPPVLQQILSTSERRSEKVPKKSGRLGSKARLAETLLDAGRCLDAQWDGRGTNAR